MSTLLRRSETKRATARKLLTLLVLLTGVGLAAQASQPDVVIWRDADSSNIPEPKERSVALSYSFFHTESENLKRGTDIPRWVRLIAGAPKQAANVNSLDEVPDSSWFTNRHVLRPMTVAELVRGPNHGQPPDFKNATITKAKLEGVTPGLVIKDKTGETYLIKFDNKEYPELQSGAEVISTKILYAAGYNVPENYISHIDANSLEIQPGMEIEGSDGKRPFAQEDLEKMLGNAARMPDGSYRVLASKMLKGKPKGPFPYVGLRLDDPNDRVPHEQRRELRGLRVIASWINHWDLKEANTLDMYVEEGGRKFLRHHLIDFGSSLGGGKSPMEYFHGREYSFDAVNLLKEVATLGFYVTPDEKTAPLVFPAVGIFSVKDFSPEGWTPSVRIMPFSNMTQADAFWATRIIMAFSEEDLANIVMTAEYTNLAVTEYMLRTLLERRRLIAAHWLEDVNPLSNFVVDTGKDGVSLKFDDLVARYDLGRRAEYRYEIIRRGSQVQKAAATTPLILLGPGADEIQLKIWTIRDGKSSSPVTVVAHDKPGGGFGIFRIARS